MILTSENDGIALENFELVHLCLGKLNNRVVVLGRILDLQLVWRLLLLKNRRREVFLSVKGAWVKNELNTTLNALTQPSEMWFVCCVNLFTDSNNLFNITHCNCNW